jgi:hypothetical protein
VPAPERFADRTAKPSMAALSWGGRSIAATKFVANTRLRAAAKGTDSIPTVGANCACTNCFAARIVIPTSALSTPFQNLRQSVCMDACLPRR